MDGHERAEREAREAGAARASLNAARERIRELELHEEGVRASERERALRRARAVGPWGAPRVDPTGFSDGVI